MPVHITSSLEGWTPFQAGFSNFLQGVPVHSSVSNDMLQLFLSLLHFLVPCGLWFLVQPHFRSYMILSSWPCFSSPTHTSLFLEACHQFIPSMVRRSLITLSLKFQNGFHVKGPALTLTPLSWRIFVFPEDLPHVTLFGGFP